GQETEAVRALAAQVRYDLSILTGDEIPIVQDGLRDGEHIWYAMHLWFEQELSGQAVPWVLVRGTPEQMLQRATNTICQLWA
ncbi:MAG: histidine kinase, partial [bacterium]